MADLIAPDKGDQGLKDKLGLSSDFADAVNDVTRIDKGLKKEIHDKTFTANVDGVVDGGLTGTVVFNNAAQQQQEEEKAKESHQLNMLIIAINNDLAKAEEYLAQAEEHIRKRDKIANDLVTDENKIPKWDHYAEVWLTEAQIEAAQGNPAALQRMLEDKLLDENGEPLVNDGLADWLAEDRGAREDYIRYEYHDRHVNGNEKKAQNIDEDYEVDKSNMDERAAAVRGAVNERLLQDGISSAGLDQPDLSAEDDLLADMGFDMDF